MSDFNPTIKCREGDGIYTASVILPDDWASRSDGLLTVTDNDRRGGAPDSFKLICGGQSYDLEKTTKDGQSRLTLQGQSDVSFSPDENTYFYLKDGKLQPLSNATELQGIVHPAGRTIQLAPKYRLAAGLGYAQVKDMTEPNVPNILPDELGYDSVDLNNPDRPENQGLQLMLRADAFLPFEDAEGTPYWWRWVPVFASAKFAWTIGGTPEEKRMSKNGDEGNLHTDTLGIGLGLSLGRLGDAFQWYDSRGQWDVFVRADLAGVYNLRINANIAGKAPATDSESTGVFTIVDVPNIDVGANYMLWDIWGGRLGLEAAYSYTCFTNVPKRDDLEVQAFTLGVAYSKGSSIKIEDHASDRSSPPSRFITPEAPPPEPVRIAIEAPPPPPAPFVYIERRPEPMPEFTADAAETFESGSAALQEINVGDFAPAREEYKRSTEEPGARSINSQTYSFVNFLENSVAPFKDAGLTEIAFDVIITASADSVGPAEDNLILSNQRAASFNEGVKQESDARNLVGFTLNYADAEGKGEREPLGFVCAKPKKCEASDIKDSSQLVIIPAKEGDLKPTGPFFKADGTKGKKYKDPEVKNGGYGQVCVGKGRSQQCYLEVFKASRNVKARVAMKSVPQLDKLLEEGKKMTPSTNHAETGDVNSYFVWTSDPSNSPEFALLLTNLYTDLPTGTDRELTIVIAEPGMTDYFNRVDFIDIASQYYTKNIGGKLPVKIIVTTDERFPKQGIYLVTAPVDKISDSNVPQDVQDAWLALPSQ